MHPHTHDLTGRRFGSLTVIKQAKSPAHVTYKRVYWQVECLCGERFEVSSTNLTSGNTTRCRYCRSKLNLHKRWHRNDDTPPPVLMDSRRKEPMVTEELVAKFPSLRAAIDPDRADEFADGLIRDEDRFIALMQDFLRFSVPVGAARGQRKMPSEAQVGGWDGIRQLVGLTD